MATRNRKEKRVPLTRVLKIFEDAVVSNSWAGSRDPYDAQQVRRHYKALRRELWAWAKGKIIKLTNKGIE